jgi:hypothetical protein
MRNDPRKEAKSLSTRSPKGSFLEKSGRLTRLELFLASVRRWETGLRRIFVWETDGKRP